jgi:dihydrofolate reductase
MAEETGRVTIHMAASLDGFVARRDGRVAAFLHTIDCYIMGSRTYETALAFEGRGLGWAYGDTPVFVLTRRDLRRTRESVEFCSEDLASLVARLRARFGRIWVVGGAQVAGECLRRGLADEVRYSILPVLIGDGVPFFDALDGDVALHLLEAKAYATGMVALRYEVRTPARE